MRNPDLHQALRAYAEEAALALQGDTAAGAELPFELVEAGARPRGGVPLYCYRPLTGRFLSERSTRLRSLPAHARARRALEGQRGLEGYVSERGGAAGSAHRDLGEATMTAFLERLFDGRSEFVLEHHRFEAAYAELERCLYAGSCRTVILTPLNGLRLDPETPELPLGDGLSLIPGEQMAGAPSDAVWREGAGPRVLLVLTVEDDRSQTPPIEEAQLRFARLLTALRLYERGTFSVGPLAWARRDDGAWRAFAFGGRGRTGPDTSLSAEQEDELRAFINLVARRAPTRGPVAWALLRYELGLERCAEQEGLTDHLLALRALLEPEGPSSGRLAQRLATICAMPAQRAALAGRVVRAVDLEQALINGPGEFDRRELPLIEEISEYLRAILRDVVCGHLDEDLVAVADDLLATADTAAAVEPAEGATRKPARLGVPLDLH